MALFKSLFGPGDNPTNAYAARHAGIQDAAVRGELARSQNLVVVLTLNDEFLAWLDENLKPVVEKAGFGYLTRPKFGEVTDARVLIMDVTPKTDARLHSQYDKIVRIKKSLRKTSDILCVFGPREHYKRYPRGTYPKLMYFCIEETDLLYPEPDLTPEGSETLEGPTLYNFPDLPEVIGRKLAEIVKSP